MEMTSQESSPILVWNPNPTLDVVSSVASFSPGVVHQADRQEVSAGGKGTLVIRTLAALGARCEGIAPLAGSTGEVVRQLFRGEELPFHISHASGTTRVAVTIVDGSSKGDTVVNGPGPNTDDLLWRRHIDEVEHLLTSSQFIYFVIAGRPPLTAAAADVARLLSIASQSGTRTVCDLSSPSLEEAVLPSEPWLVKINHREAAQTLGGSELDGHALARALKQRGARNVILTNGSQMITGVLDNTLFEIDPPRVHVSSAVGCGDCFLGGLLSGLLTETVEDALVTATAVASASAETFQPGYFSSSRVRALLPSIRVNRQGTISIDRDQN